VRSHVTEDLGRGEEWRVRRSASWPWCYHGTRLRRSLGKGARPPLHPPARAFAPLHPRRKAFRLSTPDQPCADWIRGSGMPRCTGNRRALPPDPPASGFRARHHAEKRSASRHLTNRAPVGCAATACPVASTFGGPCPRNPAPEISHPGTHDQRHAAPDWQQERGPCTPIHDGRAGTV